MKTIHYMSIIIMIDVLKINQISSHRSDIILQMIIKTAELPI